MFIRLCMRECENGRRRERDKVNGNVTGIIKIMIGEDGFRKITIDFMKILTTVVG